MEEQAGTTTLEEHLRGFWPGREPEPVTWTDGPVLERLPDFVTYRIAQRAPDRGWNYATVGASAHGGTEFVLMAPFDTDDHAETLAMVAHFNSFEEHRVDVGSVLHLGRPWTGTSRMEHLLFSPPYPYGPLLEQAPGGVRYLWLLPVHASEAEVILTEGPEVFEELLEAEGIDILAIDRPPVV
ncbi:suppressor of fused domain protein [Nocardiopsis lambiniae]|uniref:Suppressor of fused domain protein n=1 Tax=Nocardiopsis lambiniae TaxID=3075539 RepID=A0ABU2MIH4_9ACTN|nr:suppressor of fused domain protein [Nocardiopsis sp. DSM 44743]MDT0332051.1 suppressor of fused domain protein [Nocardiopsis sp. DSM 44743]